MNLSHFFKLNVHFSMQLNENIGNLDNEVRFLNECKKIKSQQLIV